VASHADNMRDRGLAGHAAVYGEANGMAELTTKDVRAIRALYSQGHTQAAVASVYGITQQQVSAIVRRTAWAHVT
jgi:predicted XRE-type DNA-binding protein